MGDYLLLTYLKLKISVGRIYFWMKLIRACISSTFVQLRLKWLQITCTFVYFSLWF